eukprot:TRINITY_DN19297_c0_g1_i1.p1 TRINITY_DN19297_c0_g1~~TRINITY_DN19297_c0_g1_i1.p1  ORF type:complete len:567 (+),score=98.08 TRINITY_DN19297_c0_g1_i1:52-1701(+)
MYAQILMASGIVFLWLCFLVVTKAIGVYFRQKKHRKMLEKYEGPGVIWPFGNATERRRNQKRINEMHHENLMKYCNTDQRCYKLLGPDFFKGMSGNANELVTEDPEFVKHVLQDKFDIYTKSNYSGRHISTLREWLGLGIFTIDHGPHAVIPRDHGRKWQNQRKTASTIFTRTLFKDYYEKVFVKHGIRMVDEFKKLANENKTIDLEWWMHAFTMDAFGEIALGADLCVLSGKNSGFGTAFDGAHSNFLKHMRTHIKAILLRELFPDFIGDFVMKVVNSTSPVYKEFASHISELNRYTYNVIDEKRKQLKTQKGKNENQDLLDLFVSMTDEDGEQMYDDKELRDVISSFIIAGRDTTACTLSWLFYELGLSINSEILKNLLSEIDTTLAGELPTYESLNDLPYLRGVVWETLRLHPIVPLIIAHAKVDDVLPDGTLIPAGTRISISAYAMGRNTDRYGEDALVFKPERWIPFKQPNPYEFPMFKAGRRLCLGRDMALFEMSVVVVLVLQQFIPKLVTKNVAPGQKLTMSVHDVDAGVDQLLVKLVKRDV